MKKKIIIYIAVLSSCSKTSPAPCEYGGEEVSLEADQNN